jgi:hypothetical protein
VLSEEIREAEERYGEEKRQPSASDPRLDISPMEVDVGAAVEQVR